MKFIKIIVFLLLASILSTNAQNGSLSIDAPKEVKAEEDFSIRYIFHEVGEPKEPAKQAQIILQSQMKGMTEMENPYISTERNWEWIDGEWICKSKTTYQYNTRAFTAGTYSIPNVTVTVGDNSYQTKENKAIKVTPKKNSGIDIRSIRDELMIVEELPASVRSSDISISLGERPIQDKPFVLSVKCERWLIEDVKFIEIKNFTKPELVSRQLTVHGREDRDRKKIKDVYGYSITATESGKGNLGDIGVFTTGGELDKKGFDFDISPRIDYVIKSTADGIYKDEVVFRSSLSRNSVYPNEILVQEIYLHSMFEIPSKERTCEIIEPRSFTYNENLFGNYEDESTKREVKNGKSYYIKKVEEFVSFPPTSGEHKTPTYNLSDYEFDINGAKVPYSQKIEGIPLMVKDYPEAIPSVFWGITGYNVFFQNTISEEKQDDHKRTFPYVGITIKKKSDTPETDEKIITSVGKPIYYLVEMSMIGNDIRSIFADKIDLQLGGSFDVNYETSAIYLAVTKRGLDGRQWIEYTLTPKKKGSYTIPEKTLSWFDLETETFQQTTLGSIHIDVK